MAVMVENKTMSWWFSVLIQISVIQNKIEIVTAFIGTYSFIYISDHFCWLLLLDVLNSMEFCC